MSVGGSILLASIPVLVSLYATRWRASDEAAVFVDTPGTFNLPLKVTYDFIIVGGGTAGLILANRLSEKYTVLVLEAGGRPPPLTNVPGIAQPLSEVPGINFLYRSTPQKNAARESGGIVPITAGKMLGGSSSHNFMAWEHGHANDYDRWAFLTKDVTWKYENLIHYFRAIENYRTLQASNVRKSAHGANENYMAGKLEQSFLSVGQHLWFQAGQELGYPIRAPRYPQSIAFNPIVYSTSGGFRSSSYTLYLKPILKQIWRRLRVFKYSVVSRVLFEGNTAVGVEFKRHGVSRVAFASKEVILSAGTFISPIILFKSGIGPRSQVHLAKADRHIIDLPVGHNLQDHPVVSISPIYVSDPTLAWSLERNLTYEDLNQFTQHATGPLTTPFHGSEAFVRSNQLRRQRSGREEGGSCGMNCWPDLQIYYNPVGPVPWSISCAVSNAQPSSRGLLTINGSATSMEDNYLPILNYKYFDVARDVDVTLAGIDFCLKIMQNTTPFQKVGAKVAPYGPCLMYQFMSIEYWKCYIRQKATTGYHSSGSCRMGYGIQDPTAVVDPKFRVIGVNRLRVVDASIIPHITTANIMAPTMVIGEKAANDILNEYEQFHQINQL